MSFTGLALLSALCGCGSSDSDSGRQDTGATTTTGTGTTTVATTTSDTESSTSLAPQTVHVVDKYGDPLADVPIVVNDAAGAVVDVTKTSADGSAIVEIPPGGSVSSFRNETTWLFIDTIVDPPPGSDLRLPMKKSDPKPASDKDVTTFHVTFGAIPADTEFLHVQMAEPCGVYSPWVGAPDMTLSDRYCGGAAPQRRLVGTALDADGQMLAYGMSSPTPRLARRWR